MKRMDIIFASRRVFTADAVKSIAMAANLSCYTVNNTDEFSYIFKDLDPKVFLVSSNFFEHYKDEVLEQVKQSRSYAVLCHDEENAAFDECWPKELDMLDLQIKLLKLVKKSNG